MTGRPDLIIADLDNTLINEERAYDRFFQEVIDGLHRASGLDRDDIVEGVRNIVKRHGLASRGWRLSEHVELAMGRPDIHDPDRSLGYVLTRARDAMGAEIGPEPAVLQMLRHAKATGSKIALYTESTPALCVEKLLTARALRGLADAIYCAKPGGTDPQPRGDTRHPLLDGRAQALQARPKSNPDNLQRILEDFGVPAERALMIGDSHERDVKPARALGMAAHLAGWYLARNADSRPAALETLVGHRWNRGTEPETARTLPEYLETPGALHAALWRPSPPRPSAAPAAPAQTPVSSGSSAAAGSRDSVSRKTRALSR